MATDIKLTPTGAKSSHHEGDKITWTNKTGYDITSFTLPDCVKDNGTVPPNPAPLPNGKTTPHVYKIAQGSKRVKPYYYDYSYATKTRHKHILNTLSGTIDVS